MSVARRASLALAIVVALCARPTFAARPLLDQHQWDSYFAIFARDSNVPWKPTTIRLDTYSGAPVEFSAYNVDPADVIIAGQDRTPRALDLTRRKPLVQWRFSPPAGYRFETSDVVVPLGSQEGFYVVEARRGDAVQQVWINRTHIGLVTKESADGLLVWGVDLRAGRALPNMNVAFLVGDRLVDERTNRDGAIVWRGAERPSFALADSGAGRAFVSILPQAPLPRAVVGVRLESAVARAGTRVRFVGFARRLANGAFRPAGGDARVSIAGHGQTIVSTIAHIDASGAFSGDLVLPAATAGGDYAVLANAGAGVGGTSVHVDAASDVAAPVVAVRVTIVREPHLVPPGSPDDAVRWGTTEISDRTVRTDADGKATVTLQPPTDGLDSTYGVRASARGASASTRVVVPTARIALAIVPDADIVDVGSAAGFEVRGFDATSGQPASGLSVTVRLTHGVVAQERPVTLDAHGLGRVVFKSPSLGTDLALAQASVDERTILDAAQVTVEPAALSGRSDADPNALDVTLDRARYAPGDRIAARVTAPGASGDALVTLDGAKVYAYRRVPIAGSATSATLPLGAALGALHVGVAVVRDGAVALAATRVAVDASGNPRDTTLSLDRATYAPGANGHATVHDDGLSGDATIAVRVADERASGSALFDDAPAVLAIGQTATQASSSTDPEWHAYVEPARSKASDIFAAENAREASTTVPTIAQAAPVTSFWKIERAGDGVDFVAPSTPGHYVLSILKIAGDGDVGAASIGFDVT